MRILHWTEKHLIASLAVHLVGLSAHGFYIRAWAVVEIAPLSLSYIGHNLLIYIGYVLTFLLMAVASVSAGSGWSCVRLVRFFRLLRLWLALALVARLFWLFATAVVESCVCWQQGGS